MGGPSSTSGSEAEGAGAHAVAADAGSRHPWSSVLIPDLGQAVPTRLPEALLPLRPGCWGRSSSGLSATPRVRGGTGDACHSLCCPPETWGG